RDRQRSRAAHGQEAAPPADDARPGKARARMSSVSTAATRRTRCAPPFLLPLRLRTALNSRTRRRPPGIAIPARRNYMTAAATTRRRQRRLLRRIEWHESFLVLAIRYAWQSRVPLCTRRFECDHRAIEADA